MPTILHVSDVHFGPPHLAAASTALSHLVEVERPEVLVVSGDLTQRAKPGQFREARAWLAGLAVPSFVVPGNHDVPMYRFWERLLAPRRVWGEVGRPRETELVVPGLWLAGIDTSRAWTVKHGRVARARIVEIQEAARQAPADAVRVAVAHHPLAPPPRFGEQRVAGGAGAAVAGLLAAGVELVLGGHEHRFWVARSEDYWPRHPGLLHVHSGTSSSSRGRHPERGQSSCTRITIDTTSIVVERLLFEPRAGKFGADLMMRYPRRGPQA